MYFDFLDLILLNIIQYSFVIIGKEFVLWKSCHFKILLDSSI